MKVDRSTYAFLFFAALKKSCRKPYNLPVISSAGSYLVVDDVINTAGATTIKLSRTLPLAGGSTVNPMQRAAVMIQSHQNNSYPLTEIQPQP